MTKPANDKSTMSTPTVEDPHPGSISDGTHPAATEHSPLGSDHNSGKAGLHITGVGKPKHRPHVKNGKSRVNTEAPRHPTKSAYGS
ncbi:hypothetical protein [Shinella sp.]|uniref:hypothetical protein n=1 Tax=unclassified Shinella TaxID=2643062 RepID=UPI0028ABC27B|nr:hypothetical protein [Shinella sp.]